MDGSVVVTTGASSSVDLETAKQILIRATPRMLIDSHTTSYSSELGVQIRRGDQDSSSEGCRSHRTRAALGVWLTCIVSRYRWKFEFAAHSSVEPPHGSPSCLARMPRESLTSCLPSLMRFTPLPLAPVSFDECLSSDLCFGSMELVFLSEPPPAKR